MKTVVLALDALDISYVEKFKLDKLKQKTHGTFDTSMLERVFTPICFAAILTGKIQEPMVIRKVF